MASDVRPVPAMGADTVGFDDDRWTRASADAVDRLTRA
jgi:hypothetical protein